MLLQPVSHFQLTQQEVRRLQHFESLVRQHFSRTRTSILQACEAYMEGAVVRLLYHSFSQPVAYICQN